MLVYEDEGMQLLWTFQQENDTMLTAKLLNDQFAAKKIGLLDWPSQSPDLNPI